MGPQLMTPPAEATRLVFSGGRSILRQPSEPRGAPAKAEPTLLGGTQVMPKKAPKTGEGAHKTPPEMTVDAATKAATTLVAFLAEHNAPIPAGEKPMRLDKSKARAPVEYHYRIPADHPRIPALLRSPEDPRTYLFLSPHFCGSPEGPRTFVVTTGSRR